MSATKISSKNKTVCVLIFPPKKRYPRSEKKQTTKWPLGWSSREGILDPSSWASRMVGLGLPGDTDVFPLCHGNLRYPPKGLLGGLFLWGGVALVGFPEIPMTLTMLMLFFLKHFGWYWPDGQWITRHDPIAVLSPFPQLAPWKIIPQRGPTKLLLSHLRAICIYIYTYMYIYMYLDIDIHFSVHVTSKVHHPMEEGSTK